MEFDPSSRTFVPRGLQDPDLLPGETLIRVTCCTLCGSDLHTFSGRRTAPPHCVLGHEIIGRIEGWGGEQIPRDFHNQELCIGQRVTWAMAVSCGSCFFCRNQLNQKCESLFKYGHVAGGSGHPTGGLSPYCVLVPGTPVFSVPDSLPDEVASPANCATATVSAAMRLVGETHSLQGSTALVIGAGMLGLTAAAQLRDAGASHVVMADPQASRLQLAREFGATHCVASAQCEEIQSILSPLSGERGADVAMDFAGPPTAVENCIAAVRTGGCVLLAGSVFPSEPIAVAPEQIVRRMLTIRGLHNYLASDLDAGLRFLERTQHRFPFKQLVSQTFPLEQTQQAFEFASEHRPVRVAIKP